MTAELLTTAEAAELLRLSPRTLEDWRSDGTGPAFLRLGRRVRYRADVLAAWLDGAARLASHAEAGGAELEAAR